MKSSSTITRFCLFTSVVLLALMVISCSENSGTSHTTATTYVEPPPHQSLKAVNRHDVSSGPAENISVDPTAEPGQPLLLFYLENGKTFHVGEAVPVRFSVLNTKLKVAGGDFRVRYIVDDDEMQWLDGPDQFDLTGWVAGKHTIRMELIGPDGWPYKNGNANVVTREITVVK